MRGRQPTTVVPGIGPFHLSTGLLMVMTLALLVYSIAERRLRRTMAAQQETLSNQINQATPTPTLRWIFQLLDGIHRVHLEINAQPTILIEG